MKRTIQMLTLVLGLQLLLAAGLHWAGTNIAAPEATGPLLTVETGKVSRIVLTGNEGDKTVLVKSDGQWRLEGPEGFPADPGKITGLLERLADLRASPVARTEGARERFRVGEDNFKRRIALGSGEKVLAELYLGTSPGKDRVHVRAAGSNAIHTVSFGLYNAPLAATDWRDKGVLAIPGEQIAAIQVDDLRIVRSESPSNAGTAAWKAVAPPAGKKLDVQALKGLVRQIENLRFSEFIGEQKPDGYQWKPPTASFTVTRKQGEAIEFTIAGDKDGNKHVIKSSARDEYFRLPSHSASNLIDSARAEALLSDAERAKKSAQTSDSKGEEQE